MVATAVQKNCQTRYLSNCLTDFDKICCHHSY